MNVQYITIERKDGTPFSSVADALTQIDPHMASQVEFNNKIEEYELNGRMVRDMSIVDGVAKSYRRWVDDSAWDEYNQMLMDGGISTDEYWVDSPFVVTFEHVVE